MKIIYSFIIAITVFLYSCTAQKNMQSIDPSNYNLISNFSVKNNVSETHFIKNETELKKFYATLEKKFNKSAPRIVVDYTKNNVALVPQNHINSYNIDSISGNEKIYELHLSLIKGIKTTSDSSNLLMMIVPKNIEIIKVKIKK